MSTHFMARSKADPSVRRLYKARRANRALLMDTFKESASEDTKPLIVGDVVLYAHRSGRIVRCRISCIIYGSVPDLSDRDYQLVSVVDTTITYNTTRARMVRVVETSVL
jgi:hypothetical protein